MLLFPNCIILATFTRAVAVGAAKGALIETTVGAVAESKDSTYISGITRDLNVADFLKESINE